MDKLERIPQAYGYARVSDNKQAAHDESIPAQKARCERYYEQRLKDMGVGWQGVQFDSFGVSASKKSFDTRPAGIRLMNMLRPGDHLIFDKPDRVWRSMKDFADLVEWFKKHEIFTHFVSLGFDTSTPTGECMLTCMVAFATLESRQLSERVTMRNEWARSVGRPTTGDAPVGTKIVKRGQRVKHKVLIWDEEKRGVMAKIVEMRTEKNMSFDKIGTYLEKHYAIRDGRTYSTSAFYKRAWERRKVEEYFCVEVYLRDHGIVSVCDIPKQLRETAREYCRENELLYGDNITEHTRRSIARKKDARRAAALLAGGNATEVGRVHENGKAG